MTPDLRQQLELLLATPVGTVALDRDFLDEPVSVAVNMAAAEIAVKLQKYIPALQLIRVQADYEQAQDGTVEMEVIVKNAEQ